MKRVIIRNALLKDEVPDHVFGMSMISSRYLRDELRDLVNGFIYISPHEGKHGPRIKFYGGTKKTRSSLDCPTIKFDTNGNCELVLARWMNRKNCPNAFDKTVLEDLGSFIRTELPVLLLLWFDRLNESDVVHYLEGSLQLLSLLKENELEIHTNDIKELDSYCRENNLYSFE